MEKLARMALLTDFYGPLLTDKQRNVWDLHYQQDLSLAEIAETERISRQAIHDLLRRTERIFNEYEEKLGLVQRFLAEREKLTEVQNILKQFAERDFSNTAAWKRFQEVRAMIDDIYVIVSD